jgi:hypothetical protein
MRQEDPKSTLIERFRVWRLFWVACRVPRRNDLYINKNGLLQRCKTTNYSRRAQKRTIVKEGWK